MHVWGLYRIEGKLFLAVLDPDLKAITRLGEFLSLPESCSSLILVPKRHFLTMNERGASKAWEKVSEKLTCGVFIGFVSCLFSLSPNNRQNIPKTQFNANL